MSRRRITTLLAATVLVPVLAIALGLLAVAQPASAHGDDGAIEVVSVTVAAPLSLRVEANITFVGDGHAAPEATATVVAERAGAPAVGPVTLNASGPTGRYSATITLPSPGEWTLRLTSLSPTAVIERRETVAQPPTTSTVAVATTTGVAVTTTVAPSPTTTAGGPGPLTSTVAPTTTLAPVTTAATGAPTGVTTTATP